MKTFIIGTGNFPVFKSLLKYKSNIVIFNTVSGLANTFRDLHLNDQEFPDMVLVDLNVFSDCDTKEVKDLADYLKINNIPYFALANQMDEMTKMKALCLGCNDIYSYNEQVEKIIDRVGYIKKANDVKQNMRGARREDTIAIKLPFFKRAFDIVFSLLILIVLLPLFLIVAILIKLESKGPVFYISKRVGAGYRVFDFYKFRTMHHGADKNLAQLISLNQYGSNMPAFIKINNDPRVTRIGAFLRKTSIDELPQFINVLKGDMSIVGNRPLPLYEAEILTDDISVRRFLAPAGITGLWQVTKRGKREMSAVERKELDVNYAVNQDAWIDFKILLKTIPAMIQKEAV